MLTNFLGVTVWVRNRRLGGTRVTIYGQKLAKNADIDSTRYCRDYTVGIQKIRRYRTRNSTVYSVTVGVHSQWTWSLLVAGGWICSKSVVF